MKIHETIFMRVLYTMDESWWNEDLNDGRPSFCNTLIWYGARLNPNNFCMLAKKENGINDFRWINVGITFGGWDAIVDGGIIFLQYLYIQTLPCAKGTPCWKYTI